MYERICFEIDSDGLVVRRRHLTNPIYTRNSWQSDKENISTLAEKFEASMLF